MRKFLKVSLVIIGLVIAFGQSAITYAVFGLPLCVTMPISFIIGLGIGHIGMRLWYKINNKYPVKTIHSNRGG